PAPHGGAKAHRLKAGGFNLSMENKAFHLRVDCKTLVWRGFERSGGIAGAWLYLGADRFLLGFASHRINPDRVHGN
ncbi:hypothetical protein NSA60_21320, partial [Pseudomonas oleovorans]|uniref:hypothetical protein n=1 Tax=Ectopseudomonas oleovorans TaxID=301 RepID=UPI00214C11E2